MLSCNIYFYSNYYVIKFSQFQIIHVVDTCPLLTNPTNGQIEYTTRTVGGVATYTCNANYTIAGSETRTCMVSMEDLTWSGTNSSCESEY